MDPRILRTFDEQLSGPDGRAFVARIAGRRGPGGGWEGWVEFIPEGGVPVLRSPRETTQSDWRNLQEWADKLGRVYLEGSLQRALGRQAPRRRALESVPRDRPYFEGPAVEFSGTRRPAPDDVALNPMVHYRRGEEDLRGRIAKLPPSELRAIAAAYRFEEDAESDLAYLSKKELVELIVASARSRVG